MGHMVDILNFHCHTLRIRREGIEAVGHSDAPNCPYEARKLSRKQDYCHMLRIRWEGIEAVGPSDAPLRMKRGT